MRTQTETPFYIRTFGGETFYVETLEEALTEFASEEGYRLTLAAGNQQVVIRRSSEPTVDEEDDLLTHKSYDSITTIKQYRG